MAEALPKVQVGGGDALSSIVSLFSAIGPAFGGGKATTTQTSTANKTIDPAASKQADDLIATIMGEKSSPELDNLVANIMERAKQSFAPAIGQSISGGNRAYSDTTLKQLAGEMAARATGEAAGAKLNFQAQSNQTAANLVNNKVANSTSETRTTTGTTQQGKTPAGNALTYGAGALGAYSLYRKLNGKKGLNTVDDFKKLFGFGGSAGTLGASSFFGTQDFALTSPASIAGMNFNTPMPGGLDVNLLAFSPESASELAGVSLAGSDSASLASTPMFTEAGSVFDIGSSGIGSGADSFVTDIGGAGDYGTSFLDASGEIAGSAGDIVSGVAEGGEFLSGAGDFFGGVPVVGPLTNLISGDVGGAVGSGIGGAIGTAILPGIGTALGSFVGDAIFGDDGSVVCTELLRQGRMDKDLYAKDITFAKRHLSPVMLRGYRYWAVPFVRIMRRSSILSTITAWFACNRAESLRGKNWKGSCIRAIFEPTCFVIGLIVKEKDWSVLYKEERIGEAKGVA